MTYSFKKNHNYKKQMHMHSNSLKLINLHKIKANKKLGQNYLINQDIPDQMIHHVGDLTHSIVIEIGPGPGILTSALLNYSNAKYILCIEKDLQFKNLLTNLSLNHQNRLSVKYEDAYYTDLIALTHNHLIENNIGGIKNIAIISNLPYNIGTELLFKWLDIIYNNRLIHYDSQINKVHNTNHDKNSYQKTPLDNNTNHLSIKNITIMLQKEVAERIVAKHNSKKYCWLSIFAQWLCKVEKCFDVNPENFFPQPKVVSSVVKITPKFHNNSHTTNKIPQCTKKQLETLCKTAFKERRKTIANSLKALSKINPALNEYINQNPTLRPEQISVQEFISLANTLNKII